MPDVIQDLPAERPHSCGKFSLMRSEQDVTPDKLLIPESSHGHWKELDSRLAELEHNLKNFIAQKAQTQENMLEKLLHAVPAEASYPPRRQSLRQQDAASCELEFESGASPGESDESGSDLPETRVDRRSFVSTVQEEEDQYLQDALAASRIKTDIQRRHRSRMVNSNSLRATLKRFLERKDVELFFLFLIMSNSIFVGIEVDTTSSMPLDEIPVFWEYLNIVYTVLFTIELSLKIMAHGFCHVFTGPDWKWYMFDAFIVVSSLADVATTTTTSIAQQGDSEQVSMSHLRVFRILRIARVMRGIRVMRIVRFFSSLRALLLSIVNTIRSLVWTLVLILVLSFSIGVAFTSLVTDYCREQTVLASGDPNAVPVCHGTMELYWSSLPGSMLTLFQSITGGLDWGNTVPPLLEISILLVICLTTYIGFMAFAVLNVVTGIFCNTAIESANADKELAVMTQLANQKQYAESIRGIFQEIDQHGTEEITIDEFQRGMQNEKLAAYFASVDIDVSDAWTLFSLIDGDRSGVIDIEEFVAGCIQLRGSAKAIHIARINYEHKITKQMLKELQETVREIGEAMQQRSNSKARSSMFSHKTA